MNANSENSQIKHCPYLKYLVIYRPDLCNLLARKKHLKNDQELNVIF